MVLAAAATSILSLYDIPALADSVADGATSDSPGVLSGNTVQAPIHVPVNACGNTINVLGLLNPAFGNSCASQVNSAAQVSQDIPRQAGSSDTGSSQTLLPTGVASTSPVARTPAPRLPSPAEQPRGDSASPEQQYDSSSTHQAQGGDLTPTEEDLTAQGEDLTPTGEDLTAQGGDLTPTGEDLTAQGGDLTPTEEDLTAQGEDLTPTEEDLTAQGEDLTPTEEDLTAQGEDLTPTGEDLTTQGEDLTAQGGDLTPTEEDLTLMGGETQSVLAETGSGTLLATSGVSAALIAGGMILYRRSRAAHCR
ncbi:hypothetical protein B1C81_05620 [Streptomyces sp. HG99]|nr:hypothetical protein B1C81_05620 [Streptomyces sp. HG99]